MDENTYTTFTPKHHNTVLYIEPNHFTEYNLTHDEQVETQVPLEDLAMYCNLEIEVFDRMSSEVKSFYRLEMKTSTAEKEGSNEIDDVKFGYFMQGSRYGDSRAFTTDYTNMGYREIASGKQNIEMFGINSINIEYKDWQCPTVNIEFTDVRGISLFAAQEYGHNLTRTSDGMNGLSSADQDAISSFFSCFFMFPYPRFKFYVKGFYGEPVAYDLAINDLKTSFDSQTGNFNVHVEFVGFKFGVLNDLTMTSLAACVSSTNGGDTGANYWENQRQNKRFTYNSNGVEVQLLKISEVAAQYEKYESAVNEATKDIEDQIAVKEENNDFSESLKELVTDYYNSILSTASALTQNVRTHYINEITTICNSFDVDNKCLQFALASRNLTTEYKFASTLKNDGIKSYQMFHGAPSYDGNKIKFMLPDFAYVQKLGSANSLRPVYSSLKNMGQRDKVNGKQGKRVWGDQVQQGQDIYGTNSTKNSGKYYIRAFGENSWDCKLTRELGTDCTVSSKPFKINLVWNNDNNSNKAVAKDNGVEDAYNALKNKIIELQNDTGVTDSNKEVLTSIKNELAKIALYNVKPTISKTYHMYYPVNAEITDDCTLPGSDATRFICIPISVYEIDFTKLKSLINQQSNSNSADFSQEKAQAIDNMQQEMLDKYLNFETSIMYITKSLWAHVETFLDMCMKTKANIFTSSRTVKDLNLTKDNSNLPRAFYTKTEGTDALYVPPFPVILENQTISGSNNTKLVKGFIGDENIAPNAPEVELINNLLDGAADFWSIVHSSGDTETNQGSSYREHDKSISIAVYDYLRNIFERWMHSMSSSETNYIQSNWGVDTYFDTHFLFIDTFYNKINDCVGVNPRIFAKACHDIFDHKTNTLLSFMTSYMQECNVILQPTQGFMLNNIENENDIISYYRKLFTPIPFSKMSKPNSAPFFVAIYRGEPSSRLDVGNDEHNENDSFMISMDETMEEVPVALSNKDISNGQGYLIPAIGVEYGKQYQNYFFDFNVDMSVPAANEVALAAQYDLAGVSTSDNGGGNEQNMQLGQDLYTVYANNSYQCTVKMMGCMWIQPLMYFQLNNVPMFRGTYMIQNVKHSITVGNMVTEFTGVRMSKYSSPFVNHNRLSNLAAQAQWQEEKEKTATFDNNCPYHKFDPTDEGSGLGSNTFTQAWLDAPFATNFKITTGRISNWYNKIKDKPTKFALASMAVAEGGGQEGKNAFGTVDWINLQMIASILYNRINYYKVYKKTSIPNNFWTQWSCVCGEGSSAINKFINKNDANHPAVKKLEEVFTKSPAIMVGKTLDGYGSNGYDTKRYERFNPNHKVTTEEMQKVFYNSVQETPFGAHSSWKTNSKVYGVLYAKKVEKNFVGWNLVASASASNKNAPDNFGSKLLESIQNTFDYNNSMAEHNESYSTFFTEKIDKQSSTITFTLKDTKKSVQSARLIDILLNVYYPYISYITCSWNKSVGNIGKDTNPTNIVIKYSKVIQGATKIVFKNSSGQTFVIKSGSFPEDILKVLKKKYNNLTDKKASAYIVNQFG